MKISELEKEIKLLERRIKGREKTLEKLEKQYFELKQTLQQEIAKKKLGELYSEDRRVMRERKDEILKKLQTMTDSEKLVVGQYAYRQGVFYGCNDFGFFKNPTTCGGCHSGERLVHDLGLEKYVEFQGDRCYSIPREVFDSAWKKLIKEEGYTTMEKLESKLKSKQEQLEEIRETERKKSETLGIYQLLEKSGTDYEKVEAEMPEFIDLIRSTDKRKRTGVDYATADPEKGIGVILTDEWTYYGTGGCEYGVSVIVFRDGESKREYFKWRDPYDPDRDNPSYNFHTAEIVKATEKEVTVKLKSREYETIRTYSLEQKPKQELSLEDKLSPEEQKAFEKRFKEEKDRLLKESYRENARMPRYVAMWGASGTFPCGIDSGAEVPYDRSEIVDEFINPGTGVGVVVVKAQIDHCAGDGKQYEWVAYKITPKKTEMLTRECAYQIELKQGKRIEMKASQLFKSSK